MIHANTVCILDNELHVRNTNIKRWLAILHECPSCQCWGNPEFNQATNHSSTVHRILNQLSCFLYCQAFAFVIHNNPLVLIPRFESTVKPVLRYSYIQMPIIPRWNGFITERQRINNQLFRVIRVFCSVRFTLVAISFIEFLANCIFCSSVQSGILLSKRSALLNKVIHDLSTKSLTTIFRQNSEPPKPR